VAVGNPRIGHHQERLRCGGAQWVAASLEDFEMALAWRRGITWTRAGGARLLHHSNHNLDHKHDSSHPHLRLQHTLSHTKDHLASNLLTSNTHKNGPPANPAHPRPAPVKLPAPHRAHARQSRPAAWRNGHYRCRRSSRRDSEPRKLKLLNQRKEKATNTTQDSHLAVGHAVEIIGKVDQNLHIKVQAATDFGTNIGMC
jgi:hypothetical protein